MKLIQKILGIGIVAGAVMWGNLTLAQRRSFFFPSASFFSPQAAAWQSEDQAGIFVVLNEMETHQTFYSHLNSHNVVEEVRDRYLTVLAPTDKAFAILPADVKAKLANPEKMKQLLKYHFVTGEITEDDIQRQAVATLLEQTSVSIIGVPVGDQVGVKLNDARATEPIPAKNGVVVPIDRVLIPPGF